jgi:hypothetical protein
MTFYDQVTSIIDFSSIILLNVLSILPSIASIIMDMGFYNRIVNSENFLWTKSLKIEKIFLMVAAELGARWVLSVITMSCVYAVSVEYHISPGWTAFFLLLIPFCLTSFLILEFLTTIFLMVGKQIFPILLEKLAEKLKKRIS